MKIYSLLIAGLILLWMPMILEAEDIDVRRHIQVQGTAQIFAEVDRAIWHITVRGEANALEQSSIQVANSIVNLQNALETEKIGKDSLRFSGISSGRVYDQPQRGGPKVFKGFFAKREAVIEVPDLGLREKLERVLLADDRIEIERVELKSTQHEDLRKRSLISAVAAAKAKAEFLAKEAGANLGLVLSINEGNNMPAWGLTSNRIEMPVFDGAEVPEFEKLSYSATVTVKFELR